MNNISGAKQAQLLSSVSSIVYSKTFLVQFYHFIMLIRIKHPLFHLNLFIYQIISYSY